MPRRFLILAFSLLIILVLSPRNNQSPTIKAEAAPHVASDSSEPANGRDMLPQLAIRLAAPTNVEALASTYGAESNTEITALPGWYLWRFADLNTCQAAKEEVIYESAVAEIAQQYQSKNTVKTNDPLFANQFHLKNTGQNGGNVGTDINAEPAWLAGFTGDGVQVAVLDDGIEVAHEDLAPNHMASLSHDYLDQNLDPSPASGADDHGTAVAGILAAKGQNNIGVAGGAYDADLAGIRIVGNGQSDALEALALGHMRNLIDVYNNSWGPADDGNYHNVGSMPANAIRNGTTMGRGGLGNIYVWAGGNGGAGDWSNLDGYANMPETIAVGAMTRHGNLASYSERGANIMCVAPGGSSSIYTVDRTGAAGYNAGSLIPDPNYTRDFDGTSAATPMVASVVTLMLEANPQLSWRDVQHILARTSRQVNPSDPEWATNDAGFHIHHGYGFGLVDADAATQLAINWKPIGTRATVESTTDIASVAIPDNDVQGVTRTITVSSNVFIEHVEVDLQLNHQLWGDLYISLVSPHGTTSQLSSRTNGSNPSNGRYIFNSVRHWGEESAGTWTLKIVDDAFQDFGDLTSWKLNFYGTDEAVSQTGGVAPVLNSLDKESFQTDEEVMVAGAFLSGASITIGGVPATIVTNSSFAIVFRAAPGTPLGDQQLILQTASGIAFDTVEILSGGPTATFTGGGGGGGCAISGNREGFPWLLALMLSTMILSTIRRRRKILA